MIRANIKLHSSTLGGEGHTVEVENSVEGGRYRLEKHYIDGVLLRIVCTFTATNNLVFDLLFEDNNNDK